MSTLSEGLDRATQQVILQGKALYESVLPAMEAATHVLDEYKKALETGTDTIFVTVGHPKGEQPFYEKWPVHVFEGTLIQTAKMYRKEVAKDLFYSKPSVLYYIIHIPKDGHYVFYWSSLNAPLVHMA
jgi:hypothetical protein